MDDATHIDILASGSRGNSALVTVGSTRILVDCGISFTRIKSAVESRGVSIGDVDAVFVTHEHSDHVRGLERLAKVRPDLLWLMSDGTRAAVGESLEGCNVRIMGAGERSTLGQLDLWAYSLAHDAEEPLGIRIESASAAIGFATDLGHWTDEVAEMLSDVDVLVLEANHDSRMLETGPYPHFLKRRIGGSRGHLSNRQAQSLLGRVAHDTLQQVVLAHMSETNNETLAAESMMAEVLVGCPTTISTALQHEISPRIEVLGRARELDPAQGSLF